ncbi:MAG: sugar-binding transcriptional regulator [Thermomicrobiales bacterium]
MADDHGALLTSVARMYYLDGLGQSEIANIFGISRSTVSRLLTAARQRGVVRISVDDYDPRDHDLEHMLATAFGLRRSVVVRVQDGSSEVSRRTVAYFGAPVVAEWFHAQRSIGVSGGRTVAQLIHFIRPQTQAHHVDVVQLMGSIGSTPSSIESSELCRTLARRFQGSFHTINAPAFMDSQRNRDLLISHAQIKAVWNLLPSLDMTVVGIGTLEDSVFIERQVLSPEDYELLRRQGAVGEICGRYFDTKGRECDTPLRDQVISVELDLLRNNTEVVAVTSGAGRKDALTAAMRGGLVHSLVIDDTGARALLSGS